MNTDASPSPWPVLADAEARVREIQTKLHRWATNDPHRRFDDLFNLVVDPAFLVVAWERVRGNKGARTAGVDGVTARYIETMGVVEVFLDDVRVEVKGGTFRPLPVRERMIPKPGTRKRRRLGIPTVTDRVVQASLKLVLEPIFEADFLPSSYGFRPNRRTHDAVAQTRQLAARSYEWVVEGDITACFDEISHSALMDRVRGRVGDRRVLALIKAFLKAGVLTEDRTTRDTEVGTPQGGILSPLLANVALGVLDEHIERMWPSTWYGRSKRRRQGLANYRIIRYADDFLIMVSGDRSHAEAIRGEMAEVLATIGLRLSVEKTRITHIDEGLDFLGWRIRRQRKRGTNIQHIYTYPAKKAMLAITRKVKMICWQDLSQPLAALIHRLNPVLRGWCSHFRPGVSSAAFNYLRATVWRQVFAWLRRKHRGVTWKRLRRLYCDGGWWPADGEVKLFNPVAVRTTRYRFRGNSIPSPWPATT